jgi:hypothetical protein
MKSRATFRPRATHRLVSYHRCGVGRNKRKPDRNSLTGKPANKDSVEPEPIGDGSSNRRTADRAGDGAQRAADGCTHRTAFGLTSREASREAAHKAAHHANSDEGYGDDSSENPAPGHEVKLAHVQFSN